MFNGYSHIEDIGQVSPHWLERIGHFFEHYKDLEKGKWVKLEGWGDAAGARDPLRLDDPLQGIQGQAALLSRRQPTRPCGRRGSGGVRPLNPLVCG